MQENNSSKPPVCVTGATGFIATHIIQQLLDKGYNVRGTVRSVANKGKLKYLTDLDPTGTHLQLVEADLLQNGSFDEAVKGCELVLHTASPYVLNVKDPYKDLVQPAVEGTRSVLESCAKAGTVKRVVVTSSMAAVTDSPENDYVYTEFDWNKESSLTRNPYYYSKVLAEKEAWKFVEEMPANKRFALVTINPFVVLGPEHNAQAVNSSNSIIKDMLSGKYPGIMDLAWGMVDVRDVAAAHILVMENRDAIGRFLVCNKTLTMKEIIEVLKPQFDATYHLPKVNLSCTVGSLLVKTASYFEDKGTGQYLRTNLGKFCKYDTSKIQKLGLQYTPIEKTLIDTSNDLIAKGHVGPSSGAKKQ